MMIVQKINVLNATNHILLNGSNDKFYDTLTLKISVCVIFSGKLLPLYMCLQCFNKGVFVMLGRVKTFEKLQL